MGLNKNLIFFVRLPISFKIWNSLAEKAVCVYKDKKHEMLYKNIKKDRGISRERNTLSP